jgi:hypothetical protein
MHFRQQLHQLLVVGLVLLRTAERDQAVKSPVAETGYRLLDLEAGVDDRLGKRLRLPTELALEVMAEPVPLLEQPGEDALLEIVASNPLLTMEFSRQPVATHGNGFRLSGPF